MKIKDLDRNKRYKLEGLSEDQISILYDWLCANDTGWEDYGLERFIKLFHTDVSFQYYSVLGWGFVHPLPDDESIRKLFYEESEHTQGDNYIQGNVYLFSDNGLSWVEGVFVVKWDGCFYAEGNYDDALLPYKFIKPLQKYEWYVIDRGLDKEFRQITEEDALCYNAQEIFTQKVTNESLIKNLNEYGNVAEH